jgi:hypothetical protein
VPAAVVASAARGGGILRLAGVRERLRDRGQQPDPEPTATAVAGKALESLHCPAASSLAADRRRVNAAAMDVGG